jgi:hypothetical protein
VIILLHKRLCKNASQTVHRTKRTKTVYEGDRRQLKTETLNLAEFTWVLTLARREFFLSAQTPVAKLSSVAQGAWNGSNFFSSEKNLGILMTAAADGRVTRLNFGRLDCPLSTRIAF